MKRSIVDFPAASKRATVTPIISRPETLYYLAPEILIELKPVCQAIYAACKKHFSDKSYWKSAAGRIGLISAEIDFDYKDSYRRFSAFKKLPDSVFINTPELAGVVGLFAKDLLFVSAANGYHRLFQAGWHGGPLDLFGEIAKGGCVKIAGIVERVIVENKRVFDLMLKTAIRCKNNEMFMFLIGLNVKITPMTPQVFGSVCVATSAEILSVIVRDDRFGISDAMIGQELTEYENTECGSFQTLAMELLRRESALVDDHRFLLLSCGDIEIVKKLLLRPVDKSNAQLEFNAMCTRGPEFIKYAVQHYPLGDFEDRLRMMMNRDVSAETLMNIMGF